MASKNPPAPPQAPPSIAPKTEATQSPPDPAGTPLITSMTPEQFARLDITKNKAVQRIILALGILIKTFRGGGHRHDDGGSVTCCSFCDKCDEAQRLLDSILLFT